MFLPSLLAKIEFTEKSQFVVVCCKHIALCLIFQYVPLKSKMYIYIYKSKHEAIIMLKEMSIKPFI